MSEISNEEKKIVLRQLYDSLEFLSYRFKIESTNANIENEKISVENQIKNLRISIV